MDLGHANKYREWFERLHQSEQDEKFDYLKELRKQVEAGVLEKPFTRPPPKGQLVPFDEMIASVSTARPDREQQQEEVPSDVVEDAEEEVEVIEVIEKTNRKIKISGGDAKTTEDFYFNKNFNPKE